jgi:hypothetical protein
MIVATPLDYLAIYGLTETHFAPNSEKYDLIKG